jgi:hypothetical protein
VIIIAENKNVFNFFDENQSLLSSKLLKLEFCDSKEGVVVKLHFSLLYPINKLISLEFYDIIDYSFNLSGDSYFYNVESYKFFMDGNNFYISLDPFSEDEIISDEDNNFILAKKIRLVERDN